MKLVILTGAGMSAESGIKTFRDSDGLWENYRIEDVCTPEALERNPELVNHFYNERRKQLYEANPMPVIKAWPGWKIISMSGSSPKISDDLHERAGSKHVLHLHGELKKVRSSKNPDSIYDLKGWELKPGTRCEDGSLLRPHVVFFGEAVPNIEPATDLVRQAIFSSLSVLHWPFIRQPVCCTMPPKVFRSSLSILRFLNKHTGWLSPVEKGASEGVQD